MSLLFRVIESVTPAATTSERRQARSRALSAATPGEWLSLVLRQHLQIEAAFHAVTATQDAGNRGIALTELMRLLTGHSIAEESVLYPALARCGARRHAEHAYSDQAHAKIELATLEQLAPMSQAFIDTIEQIRQATVQHFFQEECHWFVELLQGTGAEEQRVLTQRFQQEFDRYVCNDELIGVLEGLPIPHPSQPPEGSSCPQA